MEFNKFRVDFAVVQLPSRVPLWDLMECSTPGPEFALTHAYWVGDAIQPSRPLSSPSPSAFNLSQHQLFLMSQFFSSGGQSIRASASASALLMNIQSWFPLGLTGLILLSKGLLILFSRNAIWKHQFFDLSTICVHIPHPSWASLPSTTSHPSRSSESTSLNSRCNPETSH